MKALLSGIQHIGIPTENMTATRQFYKKLGFDIAYETVNDGAQVVFFRLENLVLEIYEVPEAAAGYGAIDHVAIDVRDVQKAFDEICKMGLNNLNDRIHFLPFWKNGVHFFTIEGPNKEKIEFSQYL